MHTFVGIDVHKAFSQVHVQDQAGKPMIQRRLEHDDPEAITAFFADLPGTIHAALEATMGWMWLSDLLQDLGVDLHLVHQRQARLISESRLKTDTVDARTLAHLLRTGFLPEAYLAPRPVRDQRMLLRYRIALVHLKIRVKNAIHAILVRYNIQHGYSDLFGTAGRQMLRALDLPSPATHCLHGWLDLLEFLEAQIHRAETTLYEDAHRDSEVALLQTIPGVGRLTAHLILAEIGDIHQFCRAKKLVAYAGLAPSVHQSAASFHTGHIGGGRKYLKWGLIEAARTACWKDPCLARFYQRKKRQKGSAKAIVAVARKLAVIVWHVLSEQRPYRPGRMTLPGSARCSNGGRTAARRVS